MAIIRLRRHAARDLDSAISKAARALDDARAFAILGNSGLAERRIIAAERHLDPSRVLPLFLGMRRRKALSRKDPYINTRLLLEKTSRDVHWIGIDREARRIKRDLGD